MKVASIIKWILIGFIITVGFLLPACRKEVEWVVIPPDTVVIVDTVYPPLRINCVGYDTSGVLRWQCYEKFIDSVPFVVSERFYTYLGASYGDSIIPMVKLKMRVLGGFYGEREKSTLLPLDTSGCSAIGGIVPSPANCSYMYCDDLPFMLGGVIRYSGTYHYYGAIWGEIDVVHLDSPIQATTLEFVACDCRAPLKRLVTKEVCNLGYRVAGALAYLYYIYEYGYKYDLRIIDVLPWPDSVICDSTLSSVCDTCVCIAVPSDTATKFSFVAKLSTAKLWRW